MINAWNLLWIIPLAVSAGAAVLACCILADDGEGENLVAEFDVIPAADAVPVVHGRWVYDEERGAPGIYAVCTVCNEVVYQAGEWFYCPNCGAKMNGGDEDEDL